MLPVAGEGLARVARVSILSGEAVDPAATWCLRGVTSNERYVTREEKDQLAAKQQGIGREEASCAALIPIRKTPEWWALTQDERREVFEEQSHHIRIGLQFLPGIARRLHHCRDLGAVEPFDFITWFEYAPSEATAFDDLVAQLRASSEWKYISREVDIRLVRSAR